MPGNLASGDIGVLDRRTGAYHFSQNMIRQWNTSKLPHIRLHECRHTASSWLHAAGIDLKTRSVLMGHASTASTDGGRGSITDDRYTHLLPGELEKAGKQLAAYLKAQTRRG
jgi:integrase